MWVAFKNAQWWPHPNVQEDLVSLYEGGAPEVHSEIWFDGVVYSAYVNYNPPIAACSNMIPRDLSMWNAMQLVFRSDDAKEDAKRWLERARRTNHCTFEFHLFYSLLPLRMFKKLFPDEDCMRPDTWTNTFCSHFCLQFLRACVKNDWLQIERPRAMTVLWSVPSQLCTPHRLWVIMHGMIGGFPKTATKTSHLQRAVAVPVTYLPNHPVHSSPDLAHGLAKHEAKDKELAVRNHCPMSDGGVRYSWRKNHVGC